MGPVPYRGLCGPLLKDICHGHVTGRVNVVTCPPVPCAAQLNWAVHNSDIFSVWDGTNQGLVQNFGKNP
jgi:hypothetical protein